MNQVLCRGHGSDLGGKLGEERTHSTGWPKGISGPILSVVTDHQYVERVVLHIETAKLIQDDSKITSLFIQLQQEIRTRNQLL